MENSSSLYLPCRRNVSELSFLRWVSRALLHIPVRLHLLDCNCNAVSVLRTMNTEIIQAISHRDNCHYFFLLSFCSTACVESCKPNWAHSCENWSLVKFVPPMADIDRTSEKNASFNEFKCWFFRSSSTEMCAIMGFIKLQNYNKNLPAEISSSNF